MIPLRLNQCLPFLHKLIKPVILGLRCRNERVAITYLALKNLEFWVDNLNPTFLESMFRLEPTLHCELFETLTGLLRVPAIDSSAFRVLGKLGGLNRIHLATPPSLQHVRTVEQGLRVRATWRTPSGVFLPPESPNEFLDKEVFSDLISILSVFCKILSYHDHLYNLFLNNIFDHFFYNLYFYKLGYFYFLKKFPFSYLYLFLEKVFSLYVSYRTVFLWNPFYF
jgi:hypothetical protein